MSRESEVREKLYKPMSVELLEARSLREIAISLAMLVDTEKGQDLFSFFDALKEDDLK